MMMMYLLIIYLKHHFSNKKIYLLVCERKKLLDETLLPINHFIYTNQRLKNLLLYRQIINNGLRCFGIKTDSLFVDATDEQLNKIFTFNDKIGGLKIENNKCLSNKEVEMKDNIYTEIEKKNNNVFYIESEQNFFNDVDSYNNEIKDILQNNNNIVIFGTFPGCGKSYASQLCSSKALYVTPYNQLCQELAIKGHTAITLHSLMGLNITGKSTKRKHFDVSEYDTIVFEEILLYNPKLLSSIHRFMNLHQDKKIIANGDICQNLPLFFDLNNIPSQDKYLVNCINSLFNNQIILTVNKRLKNVEDRQILASLKDDIFNLDLNVIDTFKKYNFNINNEINTIKTTKNISYFRSRSFKINKFVQDNLMSLPKQYIEYEYDLGQKRV